MGLPAHSRDAADASTWCRIGTHRLRIAAIGAGDTAEVMRLFAAIFGERPDPAWHAWKYGAGAGEALGLWDGDGRLVAHYAGFPRALLWQGKALPAIQIGDVMVAEQMRGLLTRRGPFFQACSRFFAERVGAGRRFALAFGFPNERALRLGVALGLYHDAGIIHRLSWPARERGLPFGWRWSPLSWEDGLARHIEGAWESMRRDLPDHVLGVRDLDYVRRRFARRPDRAYRLFCLRRRLFGGAAALAVMRLEPGQAELLDVIGRRALIAPLVQAAAAEAARAGAAELTAWASPAAAEAFAASGARLDGPAACLAVAKASAVDGGDAKAARWWLTGGDTDFR